jgi:cell division protein ZapA (FtsZ GTPase activity inhibitor)
LTVSEKRTVNVEVLGVRLAIKTTQSPTEVERVASLVRNRVEEIQRGAATVDSLRVAVLAALDIARELVEARHQLEELRDFTAERTLALVERLEAETAVETMSEPLP